MKGCPAAYWKLSLWSQHTAPQSIIAFSDILHYIKIIQMFLSWVQKQWFQCLPHIQNVSQFIQRIFQLYFLHVLFLCIFQGNATGEFEFNKCRIWGAIKSSKRNQATVTDQRPTKILQEIRPFRRLRHDKCLLDSYLSPLGEGRIIKGCCKACWEQHKVFCWLCKLWITLRVTWQSIQWNQQ